MRTKNIGRTRARAQIGAVKTVRVSGAALAASKQSMVSLDILITLTLRKLAHLLSGAEFYSHDRIHFQTQPRSMVCKNVLFRRTFEQKN